MKRAGMRLLPAAMLLVGAFCVWAASPKARYYYSAGMVEQSLGNEDRAYEYFRKAYETDPSYKEAASSYGTRRLGLPQDTLQSQEEINRSLDMMREYVEGYPADAYESQLFAYAATQLGREDEAAAVVEKAYELNPDNSSLLVQLSETRAHARDLKGAVAALDRYEEVVGVQPQVTMRKMSYLLADKDTAGTLAQVQRLVDSNPRDASYLVVKGNVLDIIGMKDSAYSCYAEAERIDPESGMAKLALADYYRDKGDSLAYDSKMYEVLLAADLEIDQKVDLVANYLQTLITGNQSTERGDYLFSVLETQNPHEPRVLDLAARYSAAKGEMKEAEEQISYAIDLQPDNSVYWGQLMLYQNSGGRPEDALATYKRSLDHIVPDDGLRLMYASIASGAGKYDAAAEMYRDMIRRIDVGVNPDSTLSLADLNPRISVQQLDMLGTLFTSLGDVKHQAGDMPGAYRAYDNALELDPGNAMALNNYAYFLSLDGGDLDKALALSERSLGGADAANPTYMDTYAWILHLKGRGAEAEEKERQAIEYMKQSPAESAEIYDHYGDILSANGKSEEALEAWKTAAGIYEKDNETEGEDYRRLTSKIKGHHNTQTSNSEKSEHK